MTRHCLPTLFLLLILNIPVVAQTKKVLFIGNSYTGVNNLPSLVYNVALAKGDTLIVDANTPGGYTFQGHSVNATTIAKIYSQQWDYVILQEQSQLPSFPPSQVATDVFPYAALLDSMIHDNNPCTETVFYMTWGRQNGDASNCGNWPPVCTYQGMQARLRESYMQIGMLNDATVGPVGAAWSYVRSLNPAFNLYQADESHPSLFGSYLAACVFYSTMFHKSPVGTSFISTLPAADALLLQDAAKTVVMDSIETWYQYGNLPVAGFTHSANGSSVQFQNTALNSTGWTWNFGDGTTSTFANPLHNYTPGTYVVSLTVSNNCFTETVTDTIVVSLTGIAEGNRDCDFYFDSQKNSIQLECVNSVGSLIIYDLQGRIIYQTKLTNKDSRSTITLPRLSSGLYLVKTGTAFSNKSRKIFVP